MKFVADDQLGRCYADGKGNTLTVTAWGRYLSSKFVADMQLRADDGSAMWITMSEFAKLVRFGLLEVA